MFQMSVKLHERLQTPKHCSSDTQIGDSDRGAVDSLSLCVPRRGTASTAEADACSSNRPAATFTTVRRATYVPSTSLKS